MGRELRKGYRRLGILLVSLRHPVCVHSVCVWGGGGLERRGAREGWGADGGSTHTYSHSFTFSVDLGASSDTTIHAVLVWTDPPAAPGAADGTGGATVVLNDLDLEVTDGIDSAAVNGRTCPRDQTDQVTPRPQYARYFVPACDNTCRATLCPARA